MGRNKKRNVSAGKMKSKDCDDHDDHSAKSSDDNRAGEKWVSVKAITDDQSSEDKSSIDGFYEKLIKLNESSGLSLVFEFRETKLDLHLVYKEVTERGGYHQFQNHFQVSKDGKWTEVASTFNIENHASILPRQIQKLYENLLFQYEQIYYYRAPAKVFTSTGGYSLECLSGKRKSCDNSSEDDQVEKRKCTADTYQLSTGPGTPEQKPTLQADLDVKTMRRDPCAPQRARTSYQLFIKIECEKLRKIHEGSSGSKNFRNMAIDAWRHLSQKDRLPFIEASRIDRERFYREMAVYMQVKDKEVTKTENLLSGSNAVLINFGPSSPTNDDYYVTLDTEGGNSFLPDESLVASTIEMLQNAQPNDPIFQMNWDGCCGSPVSPN